VPSGKITVLAIDDDPGSLALVVAAIGCDELEILTAETPEEGLEIVRRRHPQIVLVDLVMPRISGLEVLERIIEADPATDVILMTAHYSTESAVQAIQKGACDYLEKPLALDKLRDRVGRLVAEAKRRASTEELDGELLRACRFEGIVSRSPLMLDVFARIRRVAPYFRTALITGETGTGKELAARALHRLSPAGSGPFVVCNCAAIPESLFESELFGHVRGAFTGATQDATGLLERAHEGTLFLDEIGEMPPATQPKLLRAIQYQEFQKLGSAAVRKVNVRIVAATNRNLRRMVTEGEFREDLFFRVAMVEIKLPLLADRRDDLPLLLRHFVEHFAEAYGKPIDGITRRAEAVLLRYDWPGNIRELENVIGYACMMADSTKLDIHDLPESMRGPSRVDLAPTIELVPLEEMERMHARRVVEHFQGDKLRAAEVLGVSRATLYRLLGPKSPPDDPEA
jgi:DNA-binding NtrC family response regulator